LSLVLVSKERRHRTTVHMVAPRVWVTEPAGPLFRGKNCPRSAVRP
jgi:hypothetical protein